MKKLILILAVLFLSVAGQSWAIGPGGIYGGGSGGGATVSTDLTDTADLLYEAELDIFSELQSQIADETLLKAGTLTNTYLCTYDSAGTDIVCNTDIAGLGGVTPVSSLGDAAAASSVDLENYTFQLMNAGVEAYKMDSTDVFYAKGGFSSGVADGQRVMNAENTVDLGGTANQGDFYSLSGVPKFSTAGAAGVTIHITGGTDIPVTDGGTGGSTAATGRAGLEAPPPMESLVIAGSALTATTYPIPSKPVAITITAIRCITDTGTVLIQLEEGTATAFDGGTDVMDSPITCDSNEATAVTISNGTIAANAWMAIRAGTEASSPTMVGVAFDYTVD